MGDNLPARAPRPLPSSEGEEERNIVDLNELKDSARFVVDAEGKKVAIQVDLTMWDKVMALLEAFEGSERPDKYGSYTRSLQIGGATDLDLMASYKRQFTATTWQEEDSWVAQCLEVDIASQGNTEEEALDNLKEALELHFEPPTATILPDIHTLEIEFASP
jgi:predicted RNase H-like HicB family nuclease